MELLFISAWFPFPQDNGSRIRVYQLLKALGKRHRVHLVAFLPSEREREYLPAASELCASVRVVVRDPFWRDPSKNLSGHFSLTPRDVIRGYSAEMAGQAEELAEKIKPAGVIASTIAAAPYALKRAVRARILEEHNFTTRWMEERYRMQSGLVRRMAGWVTWQKCQRYERDLYAQFDAVSMVSEQDQKAVQAIFPEYTGRLEVIPNGVDLETRQMGLAEPQADRMVFNGSLTYAANLEAVRWFVAETLPLIRAARPEARLVVTGRTEGVDLAGVADQPGVELSGYLEDVRPAVAGSWLAVAPLLSGGGTRLKILEAMALGTPVAATPKGAEGLAARPGEEILIADKPGALAALCVRLLESPALRQAMAEKGRRLVEGRYGWEGIGERFCTLVEEMVG